MLAMLRRLFGTCVVLCLVGASLLGQILDTLPPNRPSRAEGTHFWVGYMENEITIQPSGLRLRLLVATAYPNRVTIRYPDGSEKNFTLRAYETLPLLLPDTLEVRQSERPLPRAVEIESELPISVFAMSSQFTTSDSYTVLPVELWGTEYVVVSLPNDTYGDGLGSPVDPADIRQSEFMIIAGDDGTVVEFQPPVPTEGGRAAGQWHTITLRRGECFLVKSYPSQQGTGDLSGTIIRASKPIGVLSGHVRASVPVGLPPTLDSKDHLVEMLLPNALLGSSYLTVPFATGGRLPIGDYLRAVAIYPNTRISIYTEREDLVRTLARPGDTLTLAGVNSPSWWYADKPFALVQLMTTGTVANSIMFDPAMVIATPIGRYVSRSVFQAPANLTDATFSRQFDRHWLNVICDEKARLALKLDGNSVATAIAPELATQKFRSSGMFWAQIPISPGVHVLEADSGFFTGVLYGMGYTDSYAHIVGVASFVGRDTVVPALSVRDSCGWLIGSARDQGGSGLAYVVVDPDSTENYDFRVRSLQDSAITFYARLVDPSNDATIAIIARDNAGNGVRYRYRYVAPKVDFAPRPLRFLAQETQQEYCADAAIRNYSFSDTLQVSRLYLANSSGMFQVRPTTWPIQCPPRRETKVTVCFTPQEPGIYRDTLIWDLGCGRIYRQVLEGRVTQAGLTAADLDFGDVLVGDSVCGWLRIWNTGTESVTVAQVHASQHVTEFVIDSSSLPHQLLPGDSLLVRICFVPRDTGTVHVVVGIGNDKSLSVEATLRGRGVRAAVTTVPLDCGSRRVGVRFDTLAWIVNRGTADAVVFFRGQRGDRAAFLHSLAIGDRLVVPRGGVVEIPIRFSPAAVGDYSSTLDLETDGGVMLSLALRGSGTMPAIAMSDTTIGPIRLGERRQFAITVVRSEGTEALTVDSLWLDGADRAAFAFDAMPTFPLRLVPGERLVLPVWFEPLRVGLHSVRVFARHDAQPNYLRAIASATIQAVALAPDTSGGGPTDTTGIADTAEFSFDVTYDPAPLRCSDLDVTLIVANTGNSPLRMTAAEMSDAGQGGNVINILSRLPAVIQPGEVIRSRIVLPPPQEQRDLIIRLVANDSIVRERVLRITPQVGSADIELGDLSGSIDSVIMLQMRGRFTPSLRRPIPVRVELHLPETIAEYAGGIEIPVNVVCNQRRGSLQATVASLGYRVLVLSWDIGFIAASEPGTCAWELALPLHLLYALNPSGQACAVVSGGDCYNNDTACATISTDVVCGHPLRAVQLGGIAIRRIVPNPIADRVQLECDVYESGVITLWAYDVLGRAFHIGEQAVEVGSRVIIFDAEALPSGWYTLAVETATGRRMVTCCFVKH